MVAALYEVRDEFDETRPVLGALLRHSGAEAASGALGWYLIGASSYLGPDVLERASRPQAIPARELAAMIPRKRDPRGVALPAGGPPSEGPARQKLHAQRPIQIAVMRL